LRHRLHDLGLRAPTRARLAIPSFGALRQGAGPRGILGVAIDAFSELSELGHFGRDGLNLLTELVRQEVDRFPVLKPRSGWTREAVLETVQSFFAEKGKAVTAAVLAQASDIESMSRILRRSVRNYLISEARKTPVGAVRRKIEELLAAGGEFAQVPPGQPGASRWYLVGSVATPWADDLRPLVEAAYAVPDVRAVRWSGPRRAPMASDRALSEVLQAVLKVAQGSMEVAQLTAVFVRRFPVAAEQADATLDVERYDLAVAPLEDRPDIVAEVSDRARDVYDQMSPSQRALLPQLDKSVKDHMEILGVARTQAYEVAARLRALLRELIGTDELRDEIGLEVMRLCVVNP
jgi:hypothetical protein